MIRRTRLARFCPVLAGILVFGVAPTVAHGQGSVLRQFNIISPDRGGVQLYGVSVFGSYYSGYTPFTVFQGRSNGNAYGGASTSLGWGTSGLKNSASIGYGVSYMRTLNGASFNSLNHNFSANWNRKIGAKWNFGTSVGAVLSDVEQLLFNPTPLSNAASMPATAEELAAALRAGSFTNSIFASMLTGAVVLNTPERTYLYGDRVLSVSANIGLTYAPNDRTSITIGLNGGRAQRLVRKDSVGDRSAIPYSSAGLASINWSHSVTPRTQVGISAGTNRSISRYQDAYVSGVSFFASRMISRRWFANGRFGAGFINYTRQTFVAPTGVNYSAGGGVGFRTTSHTFLASVDRSLSDSYGVGAGSTMSVSGAWVWSRRGSPWSVTSGIGYQRLQGSILGPLESWNASASLARSLGSHLFLSVSYGYSELPSVLSLPALSQSGTTVALTWSPASRQ